MVMVMVGITASLLSGPSDLGCGEKEGACVFQLSLGRLLLAGWPASDSLNSFFVFLFR